MVLMSSAALGDAIQQWVNAPLPMGAEEACTHHTQAIQLFSQVTTQAASIATHQNEMEAKYKCLRSELENTMEEATIATTDLTSLTEHVAEQWATIKARFLARRPASSEDSAARAIPISGPAPYSGTEKDLLLFIDPSTSGSTETAAASPAPSTSWPMPSPGWKGRPSTK